MDDTSVYAVFSDDKLGKISNDSRIFRVCVLAFGISKT